VALTKTHLPYFASVCFTLVSAPSVLPFPVLPFPGSADSFAVQILLPPNRQATFTSLDGCPIDTTERRIEESTYLVLPSIQPGVHRVEVDLA